MCIMNEMKFISKKQQIICDVAKELAKKSDMEKSQHGAVIVKGKTIIGMGYNYYCNNKKCYSYHAEVDAILNAIKNYGKESLYDSELYVVRISKGNNIANQEKYKYNTSKKVMSRQDTSKKVSSRQDTSKKVSSRQDTSKKVTSRQDTSKKVTSRQDTTKNVMSRQDTSRQDTSRQDTTMSNFRMSKPCKNCTNFIIKNNINTVFYSID